MDRINSIRVYYADRLVGTMALYQNRLAAFEYAKEWIGDGFSISPFSLPLEKKVFTPKIDPFEGLFGVFADSLPDGWGRLLVDRLMRKRGLNPLSVGSLERLAIVGTSGMGALTYKPVLEMNLNKMELSLDEAAQECRNILDNACDSEHLDYFIQKGGSSGGARPKIFTQVNNEAWLIKFPSSHDEDGIGYQEYQYSLCAKQCGIRMEETRLFSSDNSPGYFGTKRFDRKGEKRIHMVSAAGLLETSHRIPNLDYDLLMRLTLQLTKNLDECEQLYRLMCFNVFAHNRDDHSKNFSYQYIEDESRWVLSPAYDLTYSSSIGGEHATTVHGNGVNPGLQELLDVVRGIGLNEGRAKRIAENIYEIVSTQLHDFLR